MDIFYSILAGIIQGLTEFLPISSSGHLVLFHDFLGFDFIDNLAFDAVLHLGTLAALLIFFFHELTGYLKAWLQSFYKWNLKGDVKQRLAWYLFIATLPAVLAGYFLEDLIENFFRNPCLVAWMLIIFGLLLYFADRYFKKSKSMDELKFGSSLLIGIFQALALIPGVSRSGITIIAGLSQKLKREQAAHFSFILAAPIVFGAGAKKILDLITEQTVGGSDWIVLTLGFLTSAIVGYFCIKYFLEFLKSHSLRVFACYRIVLGILILMILFFR